MNGPIARAVAEADCLSEDRDAVGLASGAVALESVFGRPPAVGTLIGGGGSGGGVTIAAFS